MIWTREQFEKRLNKLRKDIVAVANLAYVGGYRKAIDDVLKIIEDEGGCFKDERLEQ